MEIAKDDGDREKNDVAWLFPEEADQFHDFGVGKHEDEL